MRYLIAILLTLVCSLAGARTITVGQAPVVSGGSSPTFHAWADSGDGTSSDSYDISTSALTVTSGDTILVFISGLDLNNYVTIAPTITCGTNTSFTKVKEIYVTSEPWIDQVWALSNAAASTSVCSVDFAGSNYLRYVSVQAMSVSGAATSNSVDVSSCNAASCNALASSSANITAQNVTTSTANQLLVGWYLAWNNAPTVSVSNSFVLRNNTTELAGALTKEVSSTGTYPSGNFATFASADAYLSLFLTIKGI